MPRLSAILEETGAPPEFFQKFIETDAHDGFFWCWYKESEKLSQRYGLPPKLATAFVTKIQKCSYSEWSGSMKAVEALKKSVRISASNYFLEYVCFSHETLCSFTEKSIITLVICKGNSCRPREL
jgi:hypothetical protein